MFFWLAPLVGAVGFVAYRSWSQDVAIRSGELMDVRDVLPSGEVDLEVRVLADRLYRVELQCEVRVLGGRTHDVLPYRLVVSATDRGGDEGCVYASDRALGSLFEMAAGQAKGAVESRFWGSFPLVELRSDGLVRLRFALSIPTAERDDGAVSAILEKASLVVKEDVRSVRASKGLLDRVQLAARDVF